MYHRGVFIHTVYKIATADWEVTLFEKCETHKQLKKRETFWHHKLKTFYPLGLNEKEEYLFQSQTVHKVLAFFSSYDQIFYP